MQLLHALVIFICVTVSLGHGDSDTTTETKHESKEKLNEFDREHEDAGIILLTDQTFNETISSHPAVLVKFFAPWCIHSRALAPEYVKAGLILKAKNSSIRLARADASLEKNAADRYNVKDYPTLKFFKGGLDSPIDFNGGKTGQAIVSWVEAKLQPAVTKLTAIDVAEEFAASQSTVILGMFTGGADSSQAAEKAKILEETCYAHLDETPCGVVDSPELLAHFGVAEDTVVMFKNIDKEKLQFTGPFNPESIAGFVKSNKLPLVIEFSHANAPDIFGGNVTKHALLFVSKSDEAAFKASVSQLRAPAQAFRNRVLFIYVNTDVEENVKILQFFGVKKEATPAIRMIGLDMNMSKFRPTFDTITSEGIIEFVQGVLDRKIEPHLPSQELPPDWDKKPVKVLVAKNFDEVTMDQAKTVFVMFYAPWCDYSKQLAPVWEQLAEDYAGNDTVVIAKMDSSENELPDMKILSFPTLKLFPAKSNDVLDYHSMDRSLAGLKAFLDSGGKKQPGKKVKEEPETKDESKGEHSREKPDATGDEATVESEAAAKDEL